MQGHERPFVGIVHSAYGSHRNGVKFDRVVFYGHTVMPGVVESEPCVEPRTESHFKDTDVWLTDLPESVVYEYVHRFANCPTGRMVGFAVDRVGKRMRTVVSYLYVGDYLHASFFKAKVTN